MARPGQDRQPALGAGGAGRARWQRSDHSGLWALLEGSGQSCAETRVFGKARPGCFGEHLWRLGREGKHGFSGFGTQGPRQDRGHLWPLAEGGLRAQADWAPQVALCSPGPGSGLLWHFHSLGEVSTGFLLQGLRACCTEAMWKTQRENKLTNQCLVWEGMNSSSPAEVRERGSSSHAVTGNATTTSRGPAGGADPVHSALSTCPCTWGWRQILRVSCLLNFPSAPPQPSPQATAASGLAPG